MPFDFQSFLATPRVVATVHQPEDLAWLAAERLDEATCDLLEFRLDNLRDHLAAATEAMAAATVPVLITARHPAEGGAGDLDTSARVALLRRCLRHAALIDIEVRSLAEMTEVIAAAHAQGTGIVASCHDFEKTLEVPALTNAIAAAAEGGADVVKLAMTPLSMRDLAGLAVLTESTAASRQLISAMGMGRYGKVSRLLLAAAGSCLNYGYLREPNAPGQWPAAKLKELLREITDGESGKSGKLKTEN
jgi:3-dehydroquinate dehydratase-1